MVNQNHRHSLQLVDQIQMSDQSGGDVAGQIRTLTDYVHSHMGASIKFELKASYQRAVNEAQSAAAAIIAVIVTIVKRRRRRRHRAK